MNKEEEDTIMAGGAFVPKWLLTIFTTILGAGVIGGFAAMFTAVSWAAKIEEKVENNSTSSALSASQNLEIMQKLPRLEQKVENIEGTVTTIQSEQHDIKTQQYEMNRKLDRVLDQMERGR